MKNFENSTTNSAVMPEATAPGEVLNTEEVPSLEAPHVELTQEGANGWRAFVGNRLQQLSRFKQGIDTVAQRYFARDIEGIHFTAQEMLAARFHPSQLMNNLQSNLRLTLGFSTQPQESRAIRRDPFAVNERDPIIDSRVLRESAYRKAIDGDQASLDYLREHDRQFGQTDIMARSEQTRSLLELTGIPVVRTLGLMAIAGVGLTQAYFARGDEQRFAQIEQRIDKVATKLDTPLGTKKARRFKQQMDELREAHPDYYDYIRNKPHDPLDM